MNATSPADATASLRRSCYALFIVLAAGTGAGRILNAELVLEPSLHRPADRPDLPGRAWPPAPPKPMPTYSSNVRARWAAVRALVDNGTYVVGKRIELPPFENLDDATAHSVLACRLVAHGSGLLSGIGPPALAPPLPLYVDTGILFEDGWGSVDRVLHPEKKEYHSSKPPFLSTLVAGEYWLLQKLFGWTLKDQPFSVVRTVLFTFNWLPMVVALTLLAGLVERFGRSDWSRVVVMATASLGTLLHTFLTTLNNHTLAACSVVFTLVPFVAIWCDGKQQAWRYVLAGFFAAFTACNELPAAAFGLALFAMLARQDAKRTLLFFVPAALAPLATFVGTNYLAIGEIMPAYEKFGSIWYNYPGSYWARRRGIDAGRDPLDVYAFHMLLGHHGVFSLTPIFLLSLLGIAAGFGGNLRGKQTSPTAAEASAAPPQAGGFHALLLLGGLLLLVVAAFYIVYVPLVHDTRNFGGWTSGPRWTFWLVPFLLLALLPPLDRLAGSRTGRAVVYLLLTLSLLSAHYPAWNPWRHPWIYNLLENCGLIRY